MSDRRLAAILYSDIHDFPRIMRAGEAAALDLARSHKTVLRVVVKKHKGRVLKNFGDACMVGFDSAVDAARCAVDAQDLFSDYNAKAPDRAPLPARVGIHFGEVLVEDENVYGDCVHIASLLCKTARPGGICLSREVYAQIRGSISHPFSSTGTRTLEGVDVPVEIYQDDRAAAAAESAPASAGQISLTPAETSAPSERVRISAPDPLSDFAKNPRSRRGPADEAALPQDPPPQTEPLTRAILSVDHRYLMFEQIGGMRVIERQLFTLARAGIREAWLSTHPLKEKAVLGLRWPKNLKVRWGVLSKDEYDEEAPDDDARCLPPYAIVSGDHLIRPSALREIFAAPHKKPTSYQDGNHHGVIQIALKPSLHHVGFDPRSMPQGSFFRLSKETNKKLAVRWLLKDARKSQDSFMAKNFDRRISLAVTQRLLDTGIRPNDMTIYSSLVGAAGALILAGGSHLFFAAGALVIWLHTLLDGCDGELARLRFQESRRGGQLDFWGDNVVHFLLFACLGIGQFRAGGGAVSLLLGFLAAACSFLSAAVVYRHSLERSAAQKDAGPFFQGLDDLATDGAGSGGVARMLAKIEHILSQRDFIYLFVLLALLNQTAVFLWAAGIGSLAFFLILIFLRALSKKK